MKAFLRLAICFGLAGWLSPLAAGDNVWHDDVEILADDGQSLIFTWYPQVSVIQTAAGGRLFPRHAIRDTASDDFLRLIRILLPAHAMPRITILDRNSTAGDQTFLPPSNRDWLAPPRLVRAGEHSLLVQGIYPARRQGGGNELLKSITIRVDFPPAAIRGGITKCNVDWLRRHVLNPRQAGSWITQKFPSRSATFIDGEQLYRFPVSEAGLYRLTAEAVAELMPLDQLDIRNIHVYGNEGRRLPEDVSQIANDILFDLPLIYADDGDDLLEPGETISFYAQGTSGWEREGDVPAHYTNLYTDVNYYWLVLGGSGPAPQMAELAPAAGTPLTQGEFRFFLEEAVQFLRPTPYWVYGDELTADSERSYPVTAPALTNNTLSMRLRFARTGDVDPWLAVRVAGDTLNLRYWEQGQYFRDTLTYSFDWTGSLPLGQIDLGLISSTSTVILDYFELYYPAALSFYDDRIGFVLPAQPAMQSYSFVPTVDKYILDVTDPLSPSYTRDDSFQVDHQNAPRFLLGVLETAVRPVTGLQTFPVQDLRETLPPADFIIIAPTEYRDLLTGFVEHRNAWGFATQLVTVDEVMNTCSGGRTDPVAIRDFLYDQFLRHDQLLKYVLLVGNGHYDWRNISGSTYPVTMPMYYRLAEMHGQPYPRDDFFVTYSDLIDLTVSRWQCYTETDVQVQVDKVIHLETMPEEDRWRNRAIIVADDERRVRGEVRDGEHRHTHNAENLITDHFPPEFEISRIFSAAFPGEFNSANGLYEKPACELALVNSINTGAWIVNFGGHGNNQVWTDERIFTPEHGDLLHNEYRLPVFVAATCNWAEIDLTHGEAFSASLMNKSDGGAVGIIAATNLTSGTDNPDFIEDFYTCLMQHRREASFSSPALCLRETKNLDIYEGNRQLYISQGDPTHAWDYPDFGTQVNEIQDAAGEACDTLLTLGVYHAQAQTVAEIDNGVDPPQTIPQSFNGVAHLQVNDANRETVLHLAWVNNPDSVVIHEDGNILFRGRYTISDGQLDCGFIIPRDISQSSEPASMRFFYSAGDTIYGNGYRSGFHLATTDIPSDDQSGPAVEILFNSTAWHPGDAVGRSFVIILLAEDESGINLTGEIGHKIELTIDDYPPLDVTEDFIYDLDSWQRGRVEYLVNFLEPGTHTFTARVWDNLNNVTLGHQRVRVIDSAQQQLSQLVNYPNPFSAETRFTFLVEGLIEDTPVDVVVRVFTLAGRNVFRGEYYSLLPEGGFVVTPAWNGRNNRGEQLANGVYFYQIAVELPPFSYNLLNELGQLESSGSGASRLSAIGKLVIGR